MLRTLGTEFLTDLKALKESSDVLGLCLLHASREQLRALPPEEEGVASVPWRGALEVAWSSVCLLTRVAHTGPAREQLELFSHSYLQVGLVTPSWAEGALATAAGELVRPGRRGLTVDLFIES